LPEEKKGSSVLRNTVEKVEKHCPTMGQLSSKENIAKTALDEM